MAASAPAPAAPARPRPRPRGRTASTGALGLGISMLYLSVVVLIPLAAVAVKAFDSGIGTFWSSVSNGFVISTLLVTVGSSIAVAALGAMMGTLVAWVLVRDEFPGKRLLNSVIDLPFALPTIVAGLTLIALYGPGSPVGVHLVYTWIGIAVALMFVTLPFVVRSVQPVLIERDREVEEAAASLAASNLTTFRKVVLPALKPAIVSGTALAFARCMGEYGAVVLIAAKVKIASLEIFADIESGAPQAAASLSVMLLAIALVVLFALRRWGTRGVGR